MPIQTIELSSDQINDIHKIAARFPSELEFGREAEAVDWVQGALESPTASLQELAEQVTEATKSTGAIAIRGFQLGDVPATPKRYKPVSEADISSNDIPQIYVSSIIGEPYGSSHVRGGRILTDIIPREGFEDKQDSAFGSRKMFDFHIDGIVHRDTTPDYFSMNCLRNSLRVPTLISEVSSSDLSDEAFELLQLPVYTLHYAHPRDDHHKFTRTPIIHPQSSGHLQYSYYGESKVTLDQSITEAQPYLDTLSEFHERLIDNAQPLVLSPGDIAVINNRRTPHARPAFNAACLDQSMGRWLRRIHIATHTSTTQAIQQTPDRILHSQYL